MNFYLCKERRSHQPFTSQPVEITQNGKEYQICFDGHSITINTREEFPSPDGPMCITCNDVPWWAIYYKLKWTRDIQNILQFLLKDSESKSLPKVFFKDGHTANIL